MKGSFRFLSVGLLAHVLVFGFSSCAQEPTIESKSSLQQYFNNWIEQPNLQPASIGILVENSKGEIVLEYNSKKSLVPASTQKLLTTAAILEQEGEDFRFQTKLWYTGKINPDGLLIGDLWIEGGGDPTLGSDRVGGLQDLSKKWISIIRQTGIKKIKGSLKVDISEFPKYSIPRTWIWEDLGNYYGAVPSGLPFIENTYKLDIKSPSEVGELCTVIGSNPNMDHLSFDCQVRSAFENIDNAYIFGNGSNGLRYIQGTIPKGRDRFTIKGSIVNPELVAINWLTKELIANGVEVQDEKLNIPYNESTKAFIYSHKSLPLSELIRLTNTHSINLYAEQMSLWHCEKRMELLNVELAALYVKRSISAMGIDAESMKLADGSGLSRFNVVTAKQMVGTLKYMKQSRYASSFVSSLPVAGESGTLRRMFIDSPAKGKIMAKSGYMERVRSYAGYIETIKGEQLTFCILINNYDGSAAETKYQIKKLLERIVSN